MNRNIFERELAVENGVYTAIDMLESDTYYGRELEPFEVQNILTNTKNQINLESDLTLMEFETKAFNIAINL